MKAKPTIIGNRKMIHVAISMTTIMAMVFMVLLVKPIMADDDPTVCKTETVAAPDGSNADYTYKLDPDCTLHIGPVELPIIHNANNHDGEDSEGNYPIQQHDKVRNIIFDDPTNTKLSQDSSYLFKGYPNVESIKGVDRLDTSSVYRFDYMFDGLRNLKEPVDLSNFKFGFANSVNYMFANSNLDMFKGIENFTFNFENPFEVQKFYGMFQNATSTKGLDLSNWTFGYGLRIATGPMFEGIKTPKLNVSSLAKVSLSGLTSMFANTNTDIEGLEHLRISVAADNMFENAKPTNHIDLSSWNTENMQYADKMFKGSDIDKFSGMEHWKLPKLESANYMYANLNPTDQVRIPTNMPFLAYFQGMFENSDIDKFPDIVNLQLKTEKDPYADARSMFGNAKGEYLNVAGWGMGKGFNATEMLESPYITFMTFGDKIVGSTWITPDSPDPDTVDFLVHGTYNSIFGYTNVWDDPNLSTDYSSKKWATLPIKQGCEAQFDGDPDKIQDDCRDDNQWVSSSTGTNADNELFNSGNYHRIFFRVATISVTFDTNGVNGIENIPSSYHFDRLYKKNEDLIPDNVPKDPSGGREFLSWNTKADGKGRTYHPGDHLGHDVGSLTLYAQWKTNTNTVNFIDDSNESSGLPSASTVVKGSDYTIPDQVPTRDGYTFEGWSTEKNGQVKYQPKDVIKVTSDLNLYAVWSKKAPAVKFNNNGGEGTTPATKPTDDNTKIEVDCIDRPSKDGATFIGWSKTKNDVLEGSDAGEKGEIAVCGYSGKRTITGLQGKTIDLYATWAKRPQAFFKENRPKDMTALLPETRTITGDWYVDDSTPRTYVAPNIDGWYKGYSPDGVWQFDGWVNEDGSPFTGAYLEREDMTINAKWSKIKSDNNASDDNDHNADDQNQDHEDNGNENPDDDTPGSTNGNGGDNATNDNNVSEEPNTSHGTAQTPQEPLIFNNHKPSIDSGSRTKQNENESPSIVNTSDNSVNDSEHDDKLAVTGVDLRIVIPAVAIISIGLVLSRISRKLKR